MSSSLHGIGPAIHVVPADVIGRISRCRRILLVEANNQRRWVGSRVDPEVHIPPIGLLYLATYADLHGPGVIIEIVETSLEAANDDEFVRRVRQFEPDLVGIRSINLFQDEFQRAAQLVRSVSSAIIVGGGPIATTKRGALLASTPEIDLLIAGEGEAAFSSLLRGTDGGGVILRNAGAIADFGDGKVVQDLDDLPIPDYRWINLERYQQHLSYAYNHRRQGVLLTSRGCPFQCTYCNTFAGKTARLRSADHVVREMDQLSEQHGVRDFYVVDDIFNISRKRTEQIFRAVIARQQDWRIYFVNGLRADTMTRELVDLMIDAGAVWVTYALESGSPRIQQFIKKSMNLPKAVDIINYTQDKGVVVNINTMYGFPTETAGEAEETFELLGRLHLPSVLPYHFCLRGYEGCEIVAQAEEAGWDASAFVAEGALSYHSPPAGTPTFPRAAMLDHIIRYHERFGMGNSRVLRQSVDILRANGYTPQDLMDMYSILQNRSISSLDQIFGRDAAQSGGAASA